MAMTLEGLSLTGTLLPGEVERSTGRTPVRVTRSRFSAEADPWQTWLFSFATPVKGTFTIFNSNRSRPVVDTVRIVQYVTYLAFYNPKPYLTRLRYLVYGKTVHSLAREGTLCVDLPKYSNYNGPYTAVTPSCPIRPTVENGRI